MIQADNSTKLIRRVSSFWGSQRLLSLISVIFAIILVIFGEAILIAMVHSWGAITSFIVFFLLGNMINLLFLGIYYGKVHNKWLKTKIYRYMQRIKNKYAESRIVQLSTLSAALISDIVVGPLIMTLMVALTNSSIQRTVKYSIIFNLLFFLVWVAIYSGILKLFI